MKLTNNSNHSLSVAVWLATNDYVLPDNIENYISATGILKSVRQIILSQRLDPKKKITDLDYNIPSRMGTSFHDGIEKSWKKNYKQALTDLGYPAAVINRIQINPDPDHLPSNCIPIYLEQRAFRKIGKYTIGGKYDFIGDGVLEDFKSTGVYGFMMGSNDEDYQLQGSIYRWLNPQIVTSDHMNIQFIFTDWSKLRSIIEKKKGYPPKRMTKKKIVLLSLSETETFLTQKLARITKYMKADEVDLPHCTPKQLWQEDPVFKYYKDPAKLTRSTKNFTAYHLAHERFLDDGAVGIVKEIKGKVRACGYCSSFDLCTQKDIYIADGSIVIP